MTIILTFIVSNPQLAALRSTDQQGWIHPANGIHWTTLHAMARPDRGWVSLDPDNRRARITRAGVAMIRVGTEEREHHGQRAKRRSISRTIDPFRLLSRTCIRPTHHR